jgi:hypothetical protein
MAVQITHVRFSGFQKTHEAITTFRWKNDGDGKIGDSSKATMVDWIDNKKGRAFVSSGSTRVEVTTVHPSGGTPYLRTYADKVWTNNLVNLPTF